MSGLSFDERFGLLVEAEWLARENLRLARTLKAAKLKLSQACVEAIDYPARRELDKALVRQLATCRWVHEHQNILITAMTGTGKTYLACALAQQACRQGYRALYRRVTRSSSTNSRSPMPRQLPPPFESDSERIPRSLLRD